MSIMLLKLLSGEDLIAETLKIDGNDKVHIKNPLRVVVMPSMSENMPKVGFSPWAPFSKDTEFSLDNSHVIAIMEPIDEFVAQYKQSFSQIVTPQQSKLIIPRK
jgi:hypothetical protein